MKATLMFQLIQVLAARVYFGIGNISAAVSLIIIDEWVIRFKDDFYVDISSISVAQTWWIS